MKRLLQAFHGFLRNCCSLIRRAAVISDSTFFSLLCSLLLYSTYVFIVGPDKKKMWLLWLQPRPRHCSWMYNPPPTVTSNLQIISHRDFRQCFRVRKQQHESENNNKKKTTRWYYMMNLKDIFTLLGWRNIHEMHWMSTLTQIHCSSQSCGKTAVW